MTPLRIDQAIAPAGWIKSAAAYSLFIARDGVYAIKTGPGWRMQVRGRHRNESMVNDVRQIEAQLDALNLAVELTAREGSFFVPAAGLSDVALSQRFDRLPDLRFSDGARTYRFQFDEGRTDEVQAFVEALAAMAETDASSESSHPDASYTSSDARWILDFEGTSVTTAPLPSPCWGATPCVALNDGRLFVDYLAPAGAGHREVSIVYRSSDAEHADFVAGRLGLLELCQRLVEAAWGSPTPPTPEGNVLDHTHTHLGTSRRKLQIARDLRRTRLAEAQGDQGRGGSAEQLDRLERIQRLETEQAAFEQALEHCS